MKDSQLSKNKNQKVKKFKQNLFKRKEFYLFLSLFIFNSVLIIAVFILLSKVSKNDFKDYSSKAISTSDLPIFDEKENLSISSPSFIVYDPTERIVIDGRNDDFRFPPASSAKIMTAIIALETYPQDRILTASTPQFIEGSRMGLLNGESIRVIDLLYGLLLPSGNDAAVTLAENYPGGTSEFVVRMNEKAAELGLNDTYFVDPSGLEDVNFTTAKDLSKLAAYALKNDTFRKIVATKNATVSSINIPVSHTLSNLNILLGTDGVNGVKTGYTEEAGGVLVTSLSQKNKTYIVVVLKSFDRFSDTKELINKIVKKVKLISL